MDDVVEIYLKNIATDVTGENDRACIYIFLSLLLYISQPANLERDDGNLYAHAAPNFYSRNDTISLCVWPRTVDVRNKSIHIQYIPKHRKV
jgi:hypothetical protein